MGSTGPGWAPNAARAYSESTASQCQSPQTLQHPLLFFQVQLSKSKGSNPVTKVLHWVTSGSVSSMETSASVCGGGGGEWCSVAALPKGNQVTDGENSLTSGSLAWATRLEIPVSPRLAHANRQWGRPSHHAGTWRQTNKGTERDHSEA